MLRRAATVLVVVASAVWVSPAPVLAVEPGDWTPVFSESFDDPGALPPGCAAYDGVADGTLGGAGGEGGGGAEASYFRPEAVTVSGGRLHLALHRRAYGGRQFVTGELRCLGAAQQFGRYEFRARVAVGAGISSVAMLRPVDEPPGQDASQLEITARPGGEQGLVRNGTGAQTSVRPLPGPFSDWHAYTIEWAPTGFRVLVDGKERAADPGVSTRHRWFGFAVTTGGPGTQGSPGTPGPSTALPAEFEVDYLRVYAYAPDSPLPAGAAQPSTVHNAVPGSPGGHRWSLWLAVVATAMAAVALFAFVLRKTRPHRPPPAHRA
ncbi:glycoside hydrolase family 16 protein [Dactylosporangium aurantiacum]|uniref:Glycoside hydrolase family 16 protein n=1 Tax=Dactylosporangium aurantiacum TaxID=35754 RepID=A0A9Q9IHF8_9ACTN|nr:glycoside hydrolase family 16 protein [Dactylosporangium aurantiacum]MDG6104786.1 glycoside hydrolase family 16 protein [Dactylosporangium aurantiacum]UWZ55656.1 glycoside hydrolase family 16 protein [Dactylosporangium aurantiacum]